MPQTPKEIESAVLEISWTANNDLWSTDSTKAYGRGGQQETASADPAMVAWLQGLAKMGALDKRQLEALAQSTLLHRAEDAKKLGASRVVCILGRGNWRRHGAGATYSAHLR